MPISYEDISTELRHITLSGRLDFQEVETLAEQLSSVLASAKGHVIVDLTAATLICSMGIRALILNAKATQQRGGRMVLVVNENTTVSKTLKSVGIDNLLPAFTNLSDAAKALA